MTAAPVEKIEKIVLTLRTKQKRFFDKKVLPLEYYIGKQKWRLQNPLSDQLDGGHQGVFELPVPEGMTSDWFRFLCFKKSEQKSSDDWFILKIKLEVNGMVVFEKVDPNGIKIKADATSWCAPDFSYGGSK
ncbi:MAG TPA: hypothetical protein VMZ29_07570 [Candidatus Bathyarchaeia archaeon]|nr:hypothetical protein [Candidatus Bathyarchaeia archaeon]